MLTGFLQVQFAPQLKVISAFHAIDHSDFTATSLEEFDVVVALRIHLL